MGERDRALRFKQAIREGALAFDVGEPIDACPFKFGVWSLGPAWRLGWNYAKKEKQSAKGEAG